MMQSARPIGAITSTHLRRIGRINAVYVVAPVLSAVFDYIYVGPVPAIGGFVLFIGLFALVALLKPLRSRIRRITIAWSIAVVAALVYTVGLNIAGGADGVPRALSLLVAFGGLLVTGYVLYVLYALILDKETVRLFSSPGS